jgi:formylglycine-generating enzyme required for sulfatase activity
MLLSLKTFNFEVPTVNADGRLKATQTHQAHFFVDNLDHQEHLEMVAIAPGPFKREATQGEVYSKTVAYSQQRVSVQPFFMSKYPITQGQWAAVSRLPRVNRDLEFAPSHFSGVNHPVESVSWLDAVEFCDRLSHHTGRRYQLPSEAQWEYACRAGTQTPFHTGETITSELANYVGAYTYRAETKGLYRRTTVPVGSFSPNAFGLYDMHGNVWEWCADHWQDGSQSSVDGDRPWMSTNSSQMRAIRGGSWLDHPTNLRSASRSGYREALFNRIIGFRVSCV